jgi:hypothetical protein
VFATAAVDFPGRQDDFETSGWTIADFGWTGNKSSFDVAQSHLRGSGAVLLEIIFVSGRIKLGMYTKISIFLDYFVPKERLAKPEHYHNLTKSRVRGANDIQLAPYLLLPWRSIISIRQNPFRKPK